MNCINCFLFRHRIKGNEFIKCFEYQSAISEYTKSLNYMPTAAGYNNRSLACELSPSTDDDDFVFPFLIFNDRKC